ncbi:fimbrial protein [Rahnella variigena]|jgi:type 1 fimbria pilin|uniref:fimbrial protein n=1 Tax=Rahnella variigena TaxID=574964 RepID=UPI00351461A6
MTLETGKRRRVLGDLGGLKRCIYLGGLSLDIILCMSSGAQAEEDNRDVDGSNGKLYIHGALKESACRLDMSSAHQEAALGEVGTGRLQIVGAHGETVRVELSLVDCLRKPASSLDTRTGGLTLPANQSTVTVSFNAARDLENPQLMKAQGVSGLGLRLENDQVQNVLLGTSGRPLLLTQGQNTLSYTVIPERTAAPLIAGSYRAAVDFHLSYD